MLLFLMSFIVFYITLYILPETMDVVANTSTMSLDVILYNNQFLKIVKQLSKHMYGKTRKTTYFLQMIDNISGIWTVATTQT